MAFESGRPNLTTVGFHLVIVLCTAGFCWHSPWQLTGDDQRIVDLAAAEDELYEGIYRTYFREETVESDRSHENSYDYQKDPEWTRRCLNAQARCSRLIDEYISREGDKGVTVALLRDRLDRLYTWTGNRDAAVALHKEAKAVLNPTCPICHRGDALTMLSPDPHGLYQDSIKNGWWDCRHCQYQEPFQVDSRIKVHRTEKQSSKNESRLPAFKNSGV